jgi:hypothetical protein
VALEPLIQDIPSTAIGRFEALAFILRAPALPDLTALHLMPKFTNTTVASVTRTFSLRRVSVGTGTHVHGTETQGRRYRAFYILGFEVFDRC